MSYTPQPPLSKIREELKDSELDRTYMLWSIDEDKELLRLHIQEKLTNLESVRGSRKHSKDPRNALLVSPRTRVASHVCAAQHCFPPVLGHWGFNGPFGLVDRNTTVVGGVLDGDCWFSRRRRPMLP